jgi:predicted DNA-binding protein with PD1-like motif
VEQVAEEGRRIIMDLRHAKGEIKEVFALRLSPSVDLLPSLVEFCQRQGIEMGLVVSMIGSLREATILIPIPSPQSPLGVAYSDPKHIKGPLEILSAQGWIGVGDGGIETHLHIALCDSTGKVHGGHVHKEGNRVLVTVEVSILSLGGIELRREEREGFKVFIPKQELSCGGD